MGRQWRKGRRWLAFGVVIAAAGLLSRGRLSDLFGDLFGRRRMLLTGMAG